MRVRHPGHRVDNRQWLGLNPALTQKPVLFTMSPCCSKDKHKTRRGEFSWNQERTVKEWIHFLWLLWKISTNLASNNTNVFSYSSGGQRSKASMTKIKVLGRADSGGSREGAVRSLPLPASRGGL